MVGDETDGADEDALDALPLQRLEVVEDVRPEPRLAGRRLALEGEAPLAEARRLGDEPRRLEQLVAVRIARVDDPRRQRVRREDDMRVGAANPVGEQLDEAGLVVPAVDEAQLGAAGERTLELLAVARDRQRRVVRREHEPDDLLRSRGDRSSPPPRRSAASSASSR